jgi:type I restriction enzyme S subunit
LARITPCLENGKTAYVDFLSGDEVGWGSTEYIVFRARDPVPPLFAYYFARSEPVREFAIRNMAGTSGRQRVPASAFDHYRLAVPLTPTLKAFDEIVKPLVELIKSRAEESSRLAELRDVLLPRLIEGEMRPPLAAGEDLGVAV